MSPSANVLSLQALVDLRAALLRFVAEAQRSAEQTHLETQRTLEWLDQQKERWQGEERRRLDLLQRETTAAVSKQPRGNRLQTYAMARDLVNTPEWEPLRRATSSLHEAEEQLGQVRRCAMAVHTAGIDYEREQKRLSVLLAVEVPKAIALLDRIIIELTAYANIRSAGGS